MRASLLAYSFSHFCVDFACFWLLFGRVMTAGLPLETVSLMFLVYNIVAFGLQAPLGHLCDICPRIPAGIIGCVGVAAGLLMSSMLWPALLLALEQVQSQERVHLELVYKLALFRGKAHPVRITVKGDARISPEFRDGAQQGCQVVRDGLRASHLWEEWVTDIVYLVDSGLSAVENAGEPSLSDASHGIHDNIEAGAFDDVQVNELGDLLQVGNRRVDELDQSLLDGGVIVHALHAVGVLRRTDALLHRGKGLRCGGSCIGGRSLNPLSVGGLWLAVIRCAGRLVRQNRVGKHRA